MTDRPILFSASMVRALLAGTKTQTRRVVKPQPPAQFVDYNGGHPASFDVSSGRPGFCWSLGRADASQRFWPGMHKQVYCPYGAPGDRLWVRETWARDSEDGAVFYRADVGTGNEADDWQHNIDFGASGYRWRPSIHMPRAASRITLEITAVRVERLQDISEADAIAEGVQPMASPLAVNTWWQGYKDFDGDLIHQQFKGDEPPDWMIEPKKMKPLTHLNRSAVDMYRALWIQLHGVESWDANPWVWVLTFRRVEP